VVRTGKGDHGGGSRRRGALRGEGGGVGKGKIGGEGSTSKMGWGGKGVERVEERRGEGG